MKKTILALLLALQVSANVMGQTMPVNVAVEPIREAQTIVVASTRDPDWKSYKAFLAGMKVFDDEHRLAPTADLRFILRPRNDKVTLTGVRISIEAEEMKIPVQLMDDGTFTLPRNELAAEKDAEILLSKKRNTLSWRPSIHSPGVPANARRLGDLRLECAVRWAVEQADMWSILRNSIKAFGGACSSSAVMVDYISDLPIASVYLASGQRREMLASKWIEENGHIYLPPLYDKSWSDETLVEFEYLKNK